MKRIGLTGKIGCGKSTVAQIFNLFGIPVYDSDVKAKWLMLNNEELRISLKEVLNMPLKKPEDLKALHIIFDDPPKLRRINQLVHKAVGKDVNQWFQSVEAPYAIQESALISGREYEDRYYARIVVFTPKVLRHNRLINNRNITEEEILSREQHQPSDREFLESADYVILNDLNSSLINQILSLHTHLKS